MSLKSGLITQFQELIVEGSIYFMRIFLVGQNDAKYQTSHKFKLNLMDMTKCIKIDAKGTPPNLFDFIVFSDILDAPKDNLSYNLFYSFGM